MAKVSSFDGEIPNDQREILLKGALQEICRDGIPFYFRGGKRQINWMELQRRVDQKAGRAAGS
jgi:hypothetical protein